MDALFVTPKSIPTKKRISEQIHITRHYKYNRIEGHLVLSEKSEIK